ncbi:MAG: penicillin-binding transpeptidase domain-containing protein [Clostridiales bacterium]
MLKKTILILYLVLIFFQFQGCSNKGTPENDFKEYVKSWTKHDFKGMYEFLDEESKKKYTEEKFIERYNNIYSGMDVGDITIKPSKESEYKNEADYTIIPFEANLQTKAGDIKFEYEAKFKKEDTKDGKEVWRLSWNSKMIHSDLEEGYKVRVNDYKAYRGAIYDRNDKPLAISDQNGNREYPNGITSGHLTGYVKKVTAEDLEKNKGKGYKAEDFIGVSGLEAQFEDKLRPKNGSIIYIVDDSDQTKKVLAEKETKDGDNIKLTIDLDVQNALYNQLVNETGTAVVMNPIDGEVLGLVSTPSYNPQEFVEGMSTEKWNELNNNPNKPFTNRFTGAYPPGSSFKPLVGIIGLDTNKLDPYQDKQISGLNWAKSGWGKHYITRVSDYGSPSDLRNALIYSDNIYFAQVLLDVGTDLFLKESKKLGIGEDMPFDMATRDSQVANDGIKSEAQLGDSGYGQAEVLMNPIHLVATYTLMLNDGNIVKPKLILKKDDKPEFWKKNVCSKENADLVKEFLGEVVSNPNGSGHGANLPNVSLAGKTGTAEIKSSKTDTSGQETGWFVAFDKDESRLAVGMMIENVKNKGGSHYVVPKVRSIFEKFINYKKQ